jgi:hypothetical protein
MLPVLLPSSFLFVLHILGTSPKAVKTLTLFLRFEQLTAVAVR